MNMKSNGVVTMFTSCDFLEISRNTDRVVLPAAANILQIFQNGFQRCERMAQRQQLALDW